MGSLGFMEVLNFLETTTFSAEDLEQFQKELTELYKGKYPGANITGERYSFMDAVQRLFSDGGPGGGRMTPGARGKYVDPLKYYKIIERSPSPLFHAGRDKTVARADELYDQWEQLAAQSPYQAYQSKTKTIEEMILDLSKRRYKLIRDLIPALDRVVWLDYRSKVSYEAVLTSAALQRWKLEKEQYPDKLEELLEGGYLEKLPEDPFGPGILPYQRQEDGFILYSWGSDFDDDGGVETEDPWGDGDMGGDRVFWPIKKD